MRPTLRASSARLIVGHLDPDNASELLATVESRAMPLTFALAEPEGLRLASVVPAGMAGDGAAEPLRWGKLVLETVANEAIASARKDIGDAIVDALRLTHRRLGSDGLDLIPRGSSGVGLCAAAMVDGGVQLVVVPPAQVFVVHQGVALSVPQSDEVGRGIWMRDDLRAEIFAGIGGAHEPDIRVYDAAIGPGDTLVLASSSLARMLTEDDVRLAVSYEDAATGAERLKQLALQRGVEAAIALVVEISGSFEEEQPASPLSSPILLSGIPRPPLRLEMPPIGSIFSTARDWLLEAVDRVQASERKEASGPRVDEQEDTIDVAWPARPPAGAWRQAFQQEIKRVTVSRAAPAEPSGCGSLDGGEASAPWAAEPETAGQPAQSAAALSMGWRQYANRKESKRLLASGGGAKARLGATFHRGQAMLMAPAKALGPRLSRLDLESKRPLLVPSLGILAMLLVFLGGVRMVKGQQARQVQQRFDSLVTAASQLEAQARTDSDRNDTQSLIRRAQALLDQAATLQPNQQRVAAVRNDLQADVDRLDSVVQLPEPALAANFANAAKDVAASTMGLDGTAIYALDGGGQRLLQAARQSGQAGVLARKGDKSGANQLGAPKLLAMRDAGPLLLDGSRNLWGSTPGAKALQQIGLKSADSWKDATAMAAYGPNLYVLDATLGNIFRYASRDGLFTDAPTRFFEKDSPQLLRQGTSLSIDGSIWVLTTDGQILKLEAAARQPFNVTGMAQPLGKPSQIATQAGFSSLYVLDGGNRVVEIAKDGRYVRQFKLSLPAPATSIWPDEAARQLYVLSGNSVYLYALPR